MGRMRKSYTENFKRKVAIETIREKKTVAEIATEYGVAPSLVTEWKQRFINGEDSKEVRQLKQKLDGVSKERDLLAEQYGKAMLEIELLKKKTDKRRG